MDSTEFLKDLFRKTLDEMSPENAIQRTVSLDEEDTLSIKGHELNIRDCPIYIFAVGKAAVPMSKALLKILDGRITDLLVIAPDTREMPESYREKVIAGSHPTPDAKSLRAGKQTADFFKRIPGDALVLSLISGGTSSLMCLPAASVTIDELNKTYQLLLNSGANIQEINTVRKHISQIKGGQLLKALNPSVHFINLLISDVPNDDLEIIGSGPTIPDSSTYHDAYRVLQRHKLWQDTPHSIQQHIQKGLAGEVPETLEPDDSLKEHRSSIISSARMLAEKAAKIAEQNGFNYRMADEAYNQDVKEVAKKIAADAIATAKGNAKIKLPALLVFYGESTVNVTGSGRGGRNQELALHGALEIAGYPQITWLSAGTDGIDGPTDAAGAIIDGKTIQKAREKGLKPEEYIRENDSYHFHKEMGTLLQTGPTGNNLMDVALIMIRQRESGVVSTIKI